MIARRRLILAMGASVLAIPLRSFGQPQRRIPRIGFLVPETPANEATRMDALRAGLREHGYSEGKNVEIVVKSANGSYDRLPALALELVSLKVDLIVAFGTKAVSAAVLATSTIPIVDPVMGDPVALGLTDSLARPGKNVTGLVQFSPEAGGKRLEFLKEAVPRVTRVALLINPANLGSARLLELMGDTASALRVELRILEVRDGGELGKVFETIAQDRLEAIAVSTDTLLRANATEIADRAIKQKVPSTGASEFAAAGGLIGYGPDPLSLYRRAAYFVDKILKGAKPDGLPIERATKFDLVINLRTARMLGLKVPQPLLVRANEVIQ